MSPPGGPGRPTSVCSEPCRAGVRQRRLDVAFWEADIGRLQGNPMADTRIAYARAHLARIEATPIVPIHGQADRWRIRFGRPAR